MPRPRLYTILITLVLGVLYVRPVGDPDLWWHLVVGRWILANGTLPSIDLWNEFAAGTPWQAYSWLHEIIYAAVYNHWAEHGLLTLQAVLSIALFSAFAYSFISLSGSYTLGLALTLAAASTATQHFDLRPQSSAWALFALALVTVEQLRTEKRGSSTRLWLQLVCIFSVWANSHLSAIVGIAGIVAWAATWPASRTLFLLILAAFLGTLMTPHLGSEWLTFFAKAEHPFQHMYIREFQPATLHHASSNVLFVLLALLLVMLHYATRSIPPIRLVAALSLLIAALSVQKFVPFAGVFLAACIASAYKVAGAESLEALGIGLRRIEDWWNQATWRIQLPILLLLSVTAVLSLRTSHRTPLDRASVAVAPLDFIQSKSLNTPILHTFNEGGYVLFRFSDSSGTPSYRVAIDGRTNINAPAIVDGFLAALHARANWQQYFELVQPKTVLWDNNFPLVTVLLAGNDWCHVFPRATTDLYASRWSIFMARETWLPRAAEFPSRNCHLATTQAP